MMCIERVMKTVDLRNFISQFEYFFIGSETSLKGEWLYHNAVGASRIFLMRWFLFFNYRHGATDEMCNYHIHYSYPAGSNDLVRHVECAWDAEFFHWRDHFPTIPVNASNTEDTDQTVYINKYHWSRHNY